MTDLSKFKNIKVFIFDVDGVLTNNEILITETGEFLRIMNLRDGYAMRKAVSKFYRIFVISAGSSQGIAKRLESLGVEKVYLGVQNKIDIYNAIHAEHNLNENETLYMGDDLPDYEPMIHVGLPCCPADAVPEIKAISIYISPLEGGKNCVRDVIEKVLKLNDHWID